MKTESLREVKNNLSRVIDGLGETGPVVITRSGQASAVLLPVSAGPTRASVRGPGGPPYPRSMPSRRIFS